MKKTSPLFLLLLATTLSLAAKEGPQYITVPGVVAPSVIKNPGTATVTNIMAGQNMIAGTITVYDDLDLGVLKVIYQTTGGWFLKDCKLYVGVSNGIPVGNSGNPRIGQFPYKSLALPAGTTTYTFTIPLAGLPTDVVTIAAHCDLTGPSNQTGWGQGGQIVDGGSWAMKFTHLIDVR